MLLSSHSLRYNVIAYSYLTAICFFFQFNKDIIKHMYSINETESNYVDCSAVYLITYKTKHKLQIGPLFFSLAFIGPVLLVGLTQLHLSLPVS